MLLLETYILFKTPVLVSGNLNSLKKNLKLPTVWNHNVSASVFPSRYIFFLAT